MQLYYAPGTISIAVAITLEEVGHDYEAIRVDFKNAEQTKPAYLAVNPKGRVPTLVTDTGTLLTETGAILDYIAALVPSAGLVPKDPLKAAQMRSVMYYLASTMHVNHAHKMRGHRWADEPSSFADMSNKVRKTMADSATYFAEHCLEGDYVLGDALSLADPYAFTVCNWLEGDGVNMQDFPTITAYLARMRARPSVQAVIEKRMLPS
jgi:glutathione S-transferase